MFKLDGKVALITGVSRGLGQGMAIGLAKAGADIVGVGISDMSETKKIIENLGRRFLSISADLTTTNEIDLIVNATVNTFGKIDILVNNAGIIRRNEALDFTEKEWDDVLDVNLKTLFFLSQKVASHFKENGGGKIINIASMLSFQGGIRVPSYTASKSALRGLTMALANEWAKYNININAIAPGYMETDNTQPLINDKVRYQAILDRIPAGRWGKPSDLEGPVVFLASDASNYLNGAIIPVDGGWLAR